MAASPYGTNEERPSVRGGAFLFVKRRAGAVQTEGPRFAADGSRLWFLARRAALQFKNTPSTALVRGYSESGFQSFERSEFLILVLSTNADRGKGWVTTNSRSNIRLLGAIRRSSNPFTIHGGKG